MFYAYFLIIADRGDIANFLGSELRREGDKRLFLSAFIKTVAAAGAPVMVPFG